MGHIYGPQNDDGVLWLQVGLWCASEKCDGLREVCFALLQKMWYFA
jgi:hypothetical protein